MLGRWPILRFVQKNFNHRVHPAKLLPSSDGGERGRIELLLRIFAKDGRGEGSRTNRAGSHLQTEEFGHNIVIHESYDCPSMKLNPGLVFAIPLSENLFGFGQLIEWQDPIFFMTAYDLQAPAPEFPSNSFHQSKAILAGDFFDVLLRNGRWKPVGTLPIPDVPSPCFKIKIGDRFFIESWDRKQIREAIPWELDMLQFRSNYGPIILENALKAHFGLQTWDPIFERLTIESITTSSGIF